jgi:hypothetical protein
MRSTIAGRFPPPRGCGWPRHCCGVGECNWPRLAGILDQVEEASSAAQLSADTVTDRLPIPLDIRWRCQPCEWQGTSIECLPIRAYEVGAIPTHALSGNDRRKTEERRRRSNHSVTLNATKAQGESCFFLRRMSAGIGTRFGQEFVGFRVPDRPPLKTRICGVQLIVSSCARLGQRETFRTWREGLLRAWSTACQCPGAKRSRRRPAFFAGRGLTGRGSRPYPLPASEWLVSCRREVCC